MVIKTAFGSRTVIQRIGTQKEYWFTAPTAAAPHGEWWIVNPQRGFVPVPSNGRALQEAMAATVVDA